MLTTEQAEKMVDEKLAKEAESAQPAEPKQEQVDTETPDPKEEPKEEPKKDKQEAEEPKTSEKAEQKQEEPKDKPEDTKDADKRPPKQKYSHEERVAHQFAQEKKKRKEQREKYQARIKELETELEKYKGLKLEDFGENGTGDYLDYKLKERDMQNEVKATKERIEREEQEETQREIDRRVNLSFATAEERDEYNDLIATNGQQFFEALQQADPNGVVLDYLNSVEKYPLVLKKLMTDMDALKYVFRDKDPYELRHNLHQFTKELLEGKPKPKEEPVVEKQPEPAKPAIPVIGKQVTAQGSPSEPVHDRAYWNEYLRKHPMG
jgi:hypothetical protein